MAFAQLPEAASSVARRGVARSVVKTHLAEFEHMPMEMQGRFHAEAVAETRRQRAAVRPPRPLASQGAVMLERDVAGRGMGPGTAWLLVPHGLRFQATVFREVRGREAAPVRG